jgi:hypothetical protein
MDITGHQVNRHLFSKRSRAPRVWDPSGQRGTVAPNVYGRRSPSLAPTQRRGIPVQALMYRPIGVSGDG